MIYKLESLSKLQNIPPTDILFFVATRISFINLFDAISVEMLDQKPYCSSPFMSFMHVCVDTLLYISFSKTLEKDVIKYMGL